MPAVGTDIVVDDWHADGRDRQVLGRLKKYSNGYWVDLKLTDAGKQVLKLATAATSSSGGQTAPPINPSS